MKPPKLWTPGGLWAPKPPKAPILGRRGHIGPGLGRHGYIPVHPEWRASTRQACGLWPFVVGAGAPDVGVPLGHRINGNRTVCGDPILWFLEGITAVPTWMLLGKPGLGKSSLAARIILGSAGFAMPLIFGDLKGEYSDLILALGGQVIYLGRGKGAFNVLDPGQMEEAANRIGGTAGEQLREEAHARRINVLLALLTIVREGRPIYEGEATALSVAVRLLMKRWRRRKYPPVLSDLIALIKEAPEEVRAVVLDRDDMHRYRDEVFPLLRTLLALCDGPLGAMFNRQTTTKLTLDTTAACIDVSAISASDKKLQAAALIASWNEGFGSVEAHNALADAGLAPQLWYLIVLDELWRVLQSGEGLVARVDEATRLNRSQDAAGLMLITHTLADMRALNNPVEAEKARGFVERSGAIACFGLPEQELDDLDKIVRFSAKERRTIIEAGTPPSWKRARRARKQQTGPLPQGPNNAPGLGKVVLKVGNRAGIPLQVKLVDTELALHNTSRRWAA